MGRRPENPLKTLPCNTATPLDSIHREAIRLYTCAFRALPVVSLHAEAYDPPLELRRNELGLRFLYWLGSKSHIYRIPKYPG